MTAAVSVARSPGDYDGFGTLIRAYVDWCRTRYRELPWVVDAAFSHQALDAELGRLPTTYGSPNGKTLLATRDGRLLGCVAYRKLSEDVCEMKRLFVPEQFHGAGIGRKLCLRIVGEAKADGFALMRLDTGHLLHEAQALYRSVGFATCEPYVDYPEALARLIVFMERRLA